MPIICLCQVVEPCATLSETEIGRGFNQRPSSALARSTSTTDSSKSLMIRL